MWVRAVDAEYFYAQTRWAVQLFADAAELPRSQFPLVPIRSVVVERRETGDPQDFGEELIVYLGLENVRSRTGELVDFDRRPGKSVKSRSKMFRPGDVLYGRLRPELNKVYLAHEPAPSGFCSGEFVVLAPIEGAVSPRYLRHILASPFVSGVIGQFRAGASLPRVSSADLLDIDIPLPPLQTQVALATLLEKRDKRLRELRREVLRFPGDTEAMLLERLESGTDSATG